VGSTSCLRFKSRRPSFCTLNASSLVYTCLGIGCCAPPALSHREPRRERGVNCRPCITPISVAGFMHLTHQRAARENKRLSSYKALYSPRINGGKRSNLEVRRVICGCGLARSRVKVIPWAIMCTTKRAGLMKVDSSSTSHGSEMAGRGSCCRRWTTCQTPRQPPCPDNTPSDTRSAQRCLCLYDSAVSLRADHAPNISRFEN